MAGERRITALRNRYWTLNGRAINEHDTLDIPRELRLAAASLEVVV